MDLMWKTKKDYKNMELEQMIMARKIGFVEQQLLTPEQSSINQKLYELDRMAHRMNMKWGVGRLLELTPLELRSKWDTQIKRLEGAVMAQEVPVVVELVEGALRGWGALERSATALGHMPYEPICWCVAVEGMEYRVVRHMTELEALGSDPRRPAISLEELVRVYHDRRAGAYMVPVERVGGGLKDSGKGMNQEIPF